MGSDPGPVAATLVCDAPTSGCCCSAALAAAAVTALLPHTPMHLPDQVATPAPTHPPTCMQRSCQQLTHMPTQPANSRAHPTTHTRTYKHTCVHPPTLPPTTSTNLHVAVPPQLDLPPLLYAELQPQRHLLPQLVVVGGGRQRGRPAAPHGNALQRQAGGQGRALGRWAARTACTACAQRACAALVLGRQLSNLCLFCTPSPSS